MAIETVKLATVGRRGLPAMSAEGVSDSPVRANRLGELYAYITGKTNYAMCDEGSYFVATNPTPGTGIAGIAATGAFSDLESLLVVKNTAAAGSGKNLYLDYLKLLVTVAGTSGTDHRFVSKIDGPSANRYTSGGSDIVPVNPNGDGAAPSATVKFGALVTAAASAGARLVGGGILRRATIVVAADEFVFNFGGPMPNQLRPGTLAADSTTNVSCAVAHCPVILPPQWEYVLAVHAASQTVGTSYEFELGGWQK
jgi:hypothetical protein